MIRIKGSKLSEGVALGQAFILNNRIVDKYCINDSPAEINRLKVGIENLRAIYASVDDATNIINSYEAILLDEEFLGEIFKLIEAEKVNAEYAVEAIASKYANMLEGLDDNYLRERAADIKAVADELIGVLANDKVGEAAQISNEIPTNNLLTRDETRTNNKLVIREETQTNNLLAREDTPTNIILVAREIKPSDVIKYKDSVRGFVSGRGSSNSHATILARNAGLPLIVCGDLWIKKEDSAKELLEQDTSLGSSHTLIIDDDLIVDPDDETIARYLSNHNTNRKYDKFEAVRRVIKDNNLKLEVMANVSSVEEIVELTEKEKIERISSLAVKEDSEKFNSFKAKEDSEKFSSFKAKDNSEIINTSINVGLFRTEMLFMDRDEVPSEEEQFAIYKEAAIRVNGGRLVIRTMDIGLDKEVKWLKVEDKSLRGIQLSLAYPEIFKTQLRAIIRASEYGNIEIMYPMISTMEEAKVIGKIVDEAMDELNGRFKQKYLDDNQNRRDCAKINQSKREVYITPVQGYMIETKEAVDNIDELASKSDFISIGTNDLIHYCLGIDRVSDVRQYDDDTKDAIMKLIEKIISGAHKFGKKVCVCGELAKDTSLTLMLSRAGVDSISL